MVLADTAETEILRRRGFLGARLGHPDVRGAPGYRGPAYLYPRRGGIGCWTRALIVHCALAGVVVRTGVRVTRTVCRSDSIRSLILSTGDEIAADAVVLAASPSALGVETALPCGPVPTRPLGVAHLTVVGSPAHDLHWFVSYDPSTLVHRAAFLERLRGEKRQAGLTSLVVEHRGSGAPLHQLVDELQALGALARSLATAPRGHAVAARAVSEGDDRRLPAEAGGAASHWPAAKPRRDRSIAGGFRPGASRRLGGCPMRGGDGLGSGGLP